MMNGFIVELLNFVFAPLFSLRETPDESNPRNINRPALNAEDCFMGANDRLGKMIDYKIGKGC
jgi:hypothetical protein